MTAPRSGRPDPDGHHDDLSAEDLDGLSLVVPDDPRELAADRVAWLHEQAERVARHQPPSPPADPRPATDRRPLRARETAAARKQRLSLTAGIVVISMLAVAVSGAIGAFVIPGERDTLPPAPLAAVTPGPGQIGGLLPAATLTDANGPLTARSIRPAVITLVPAECTTCEDLMREVRRQASEYGLGVTMVGAPAQSGQLSDLERALGGYRIDVLSDPAAAFAQAYGSTVPTLLLVTDQGVVADIVRNPPLDLRLEPTLVGLSGDFGA